MRPGSRVRVAVHTNLAGFDIIPDVFGLEGTIVEPGVDLDWRVLVETPEWKHPTLQLGFDQLELELVEE